MTTYVTLDKNANVRARGSKEICEDRAKSLEKAKKGFGPFEVKSEAAHMKAVKERQEAERELSLSLQGASTTSADAILAGLQKLVEAQG